jgi:hypothetical protein
MRKQLRFVSISGTPLVKDGGVELQFITDPARNEDDVVIEMSRDELKRLYERIGDRLHAEVYGR